MSSNLKNELKLFNEAIFLKRVQTKKLIQKFQ